VRHLLHVSSCLLLIALTACGGGGGAGGGAPATSISVTPSSITFTAIEGDPSPAPATAQVSFHGAGVVVGYAPGVPQPAWLTVAQQGTATTSTVDFSLTASDTATVGTRTTTVRFVTGLADQTQVVFADLPVTFTVTPSDLAVSTNPTSLTFTANAGSAPPAAQNVTVTFKGSSLSVSGTPAWLTLTPPANPNASPATYSVAVNSTAFPGGTSQSADLVFTTAQTGSTLQRTATVHVVFNVVQSFDVTAAATPLAFTSIAKSTQPPQPAAGYALSVVGSQASWSVSADQPWIMFSPASGTNAGSISVTAVGTGLAKGAFNGNIVITDSNSMTTRSFPVTLVNRAANLTVAPARLSFNIDSTSAASALSQSVVVSDELNSAQASEAVTWTLQTGSAPWLQWTPASGTSVPAVNATAALKITELQKLVPGQYSTTVTLSTVNSAGTTQTVTIPVVLNYQPAYVAFVSPYLGIANKAGSFFLRGLNFAVTGAPLTVTIGSTQIANLTPDGDTQLRVDYPALAAGTYTVAVKNAAGIVASNAALVLVNPPTLVYQAISAPSTRQRLVYDAERSVLYAVDQADAEIQSFKLSGGVWTAGTPYILPQLVDIVLSPNGRLMIALTRGSVDDIPLTGAPFIATPRASEPGFSEIFTALCMTNDGNAFITTQYLGSGFTASYLYDITDYAVIGNPYFIGYLYDGLAAASADGSRVYAGSNGVSPAQSIAIYNSLDHSITHSNSTVTYNLNAASVSGDASRVILNTTDVYSASLSITGQLPAGTGGVTLASRDASRAYVYRDDAGGGGPRLDIYNLNGALQAGALYPLLKTVTLADSPNTGAGVYNTIAMAESPDGNTVFVSGNSRVLVVPVN
jgi:hypothetical protein